ncbi:alpha/beta fold hydrolase [Dactylosporangium sp. CA-233914]|uniref:alpha/beta fold hydrolase n=1 Tax=Dactylosporangium sp. CA-233914 TaxID=3239934 RepID=UPI003D91E72F
MEIAYLLVHSPLLGPRSWTPVAQRLRAAGAAVVVPSLVGIGAGGPPFGPPVGEAVGAAARELPAGQPVAVVAHSSAGLFVPVVVEALAGTVAANVFVEAALPARSGPTRPATDERLAVLRGMAEDGILPQWTEWWDPAGLPALFPDPETWRAVSAEQPRLPLSYYEQPVPNPPGWERLPCGYIRFSPAYEKVAAEARDRGWPVIHIPGAHLHQLVDPDAVAGAIVSLTEERP